MPVVFTPYLKQKLSRGTEDSAAESEQSETDESRDSDTDTESESGTATGAKAKRLVAVAVAGVAGLAATYWLWKRRQAPSADAERSAPSEQDDR